MNDTHHWEWQNLNDVKIAFIFSTQKHNLISFSFFILGWNVTWACLREVYPCTIAFVYNSVANHTRAEMRCNAGVSPGPRGHALQCSWGDKEWYVWRVCVCLLVFVAVWISSFHWYNMQYHVSAELSHPEHEPYTRAHRSIQHRQTKEKSFD